MDNVDGRHEQASILSSDGGIIGWKKSCDGSLSPLEGIQREPVVDGGGEGKTGVDGKGAALKGWKGFGEHERSHVQMLSLEYECECRNPAPGSPVEKDCCVRISPVASGKL